MRVHRATEVRETLAEWVPRGFVCRTFAVMTEIRHFTSMTPAVVSRACAHDPVTRSLVRQTSRLAPDIIPSDSHITPMRKHMTAMTILIVAPLSLIIALLFHTILMMSVTSARTILFIALMLRVI